MDILKSAPSLLRFLDLNFIEFPFDEMRLTGLLERMREELDWTERSPKPTVTIAMEGHRIWPGRFIKLLGEVASFLCGSPCMEQIQAARKMDTGRIMTSLRRSTLGLTSISWILRNWDSFVRNAIQLILKPKV
jgi:hypothetical protein